MKPFLDEDFLLETKTAEILYHQYAKNMPIYDYHCHLPVKEIYEDRHYDSITDLWLVDGKSGDHYKWRALRCNGVDEQYITGTADKKEKFMKWAETMPYLLANPLYHWSHLELKRYFGCNEPLSLKNAEQYYKKMNLFLKEHGTREIIMMSHVDTICTTDDPTDDLKYHQLLAKDESFPVHVYPTFRPDQLLNIEKKTYPDYIQKLSDVVNAPIDDLTSLKKAIKERIHYFNESSCRVSDHSLEQVLFEETTEEEINDIFIKALQRKPLSPCEQAKYKGYLLVFLGKEYHRYGWVQQYHIKALRNNSTKMFNQIGPDAGCDSINDGFIAENLSKILNELDRADQLPKTIAYSLNPSDLEVLATLLFSFSQSGVPGKMQLGSAWWFMDQKDGMERQLQTLSNLGLLSRFVGMLTDSRSFLSYTRHEYFRRILCNYVGNLVESGQYPNDMAFLGQMIQDICYYNAKQYFDHKK